MSVEINMGRTVVLEDRLRAEFEQLIGTRQAHVGLLVGQVKLYAPISQIILTHAYVNTEH